MPKKIVILSVAALMIIAFAGCEIFGGGTGVKGKLILEPGQSGDVRNARIELYETSDLTGDPVKIGQSESGGTDVSEAEFKLTDVLPGYYYLLAWKDIDGDGDISGGDLVGVYGGTYKPGKGGQKLTIEDNKLTDVGQISMRIFVEPLAVVASGAIGDQGYSVTYTYTFNENVTLSTFTVTVPGYDPYPDTEETGARNSGQSYTTQKYVIGGGEVLIPHGTHTLRFQGTASGDAFDLTVNITL
ncbi:hypothetical protein GX441_12725 [bacterium]|nr:hypothetical protein [bacterium]